MLLKLFYLAVFSSALANGERNVFNMQQDFRTNDDEHFNSEVSESDWRMPYSFGYTINDPATGDMKEAQENSEGGVVTGVYRFVQPDGCIRTVRYTADSNGFQPMVSYEGPCHGTDPESVLINSYRPSSILNQNAHFGQSFTHGASSSVGIAGDQLSVTSPFLQEQPHYVPAPITTTETSFPLTDKPPTTLPPITPIYPTAKPITTTTISTPAPMTTFPSSSLLPPPSYSFSDSTETSSKFPIPDYASGLLPDFFKPSSFYSPGSSYVAVADYHLKEHAYRPAAVKPVSSNYAIRPTLTRYRKPSGGVLYGYASRPTTSIRPYPLRSWPQGYGQQGPPRARPINNPVGHQGSYMAGMRPSPAAAAPAAYTPYTYYRK